MKHGLEFDGNSLKDILKAQVREHIDCSSESILRKYLEALGHRLLFLPPYSPTLNPIEEIWGSAKNHIARGRTAVAGVFTKEKTVELLKAGLDLANSRPTPHHRNMWGAAFAHADAVAQKSYDEYYANDPVV